MTLDERAAHREPFCIAGREVRPGERALVRLPAPDELGRGNMSLPVHVVHGRRPGPTLFVSAGVHGDEVNGVEVVRRLLARRGLSELRGTLLAIPVVNIYGFIHRSRYLPDRRDLNRSFPGREAGSLAARLAHLVSNQIIARCTHGIDLHTGAVHRTNFPHLRGNLDDPRTLPLARAFRSPLLLGFDGITGTMLEVTRAHDIPLLVFEGGEALRFDETAIRTAVRGTLSVMRAIEMLPPARTPKPPFEPIVARHRQWIRAPGSGMLLTKLEPGASVDKGQLLARIAEPYTGELIEILSPMDGLVVGKLVLPLVNEGDAIVHLAYRGEDPASLADILDDDLDDPQPGVSWSE